MKLQSLKKLTFKKQFWIFQYRERRIIDYWKGLEKSGSLTNDQYKKTKTIGNRPGILYGLCTVYKAITDVCLPFRPTLSLIGTSCYKLAKFLVPKLSSVMLNEFTVKDSFAFAEETVHQSNFSRAPLMLTQSSVVYHLKRISILYTTWKGTEGCWCSNISEHISSYNLQTFVKSTDFVIHGVAMKHPNSRVIIKFSFKKFIYKNLPFRQFYIVYSCNRI